MTRPVNEEIETEAARWVARMDGETWSEADEAELQRWLAAVPRRAGALLQAQAAWETLDAASAARSALAGASEIGDTGPHLPNPASSRRRFLIGGGFAMAASFAGGLILLGGTDSYETEIGEIRRVPLADGSTVAINTASLISVNLEKARRAIRLERGEAWFQVAKDPRRPFVVDAGHVRVRAIGTAFAVRRRSDGADIFVTEGVVEVWSANGTGKHIRIAAGGSASIANDAPIEHIAANASSIDRALAWREGKIDLAGVRLVDAAAEFNRYNRRRLIIANPAIADERFDGIFRTDDLEGFAIAIRESLDVAVDLSDPAEIRIGGRSRE